MSQTINGYILIADISGYTMYLTESELEHAQEVLKSLLEILIAHTKLPLIISRLEGDAVISYAPEGSFTQGGMVIDVVESCYVAFQQGIELMIVNTTCRCNACKNIPNLDLKFLMHFGTFGLQKLPTYTELIGTDVNLIHRLAKNHVQEKTGFKAYALLTRPALESLGIPELAEELQYYTETYEHLGEVEVFVRDMAPVWERERERNRMVVKPEEAMMVMSLDFAVPVMMLWDYLTSPNYRAIFLGADSVIPEKLRAGRISEGTIYQCAHGDEMHLQTVVDWQPFHSLTLLHQPPVGPTALGTYELESLGKGSRMTMLFGRPHLESRLQRFFSETMMRLYWRFRGMKGVRAFQARIEQEWKEGKPSQMEPVEFDIAEIRRSIEDALQASDQVE